MKDKFDVIKTIGINSSCDGDINPYVEACDKVILCKTLKIPCNKKQICGIKSIYIGVNIDSVEVVSQPATNIATTNGSMAEERKLYITGSITEKILYNTNDCCKKTDFLSVKISFCKYLSIECNYVKDMNDYCVKPYIRKVCAKTLNKRCISEDIELILSAFKKTSISNRTDELQNIIKFYGEEDLEIAQIEFDEKDKQLIVTSTGIIANSEFKDEQYFQVVLKDSSGVVKTKAAVMGNENADNFSKTLNGASFQIDDIIELDYMENHRVEITNYPEMGQVPYNPLGNNEEYIVTPDGLFAYVPPDSVVLSSITVFGITSNAIVRINFIEDNNRVIAMSSGNVVDINGMADKYFTIIIKDNKGTIKIEESIMWRENANDFVRVLDEYVFEYGDIVTLQCSNIKGVLIVNKDSEEFNPTNVEENYVITDDGLKPLEKIIDYFQQ